MPNRLADATSAYLRQHAGNPVNWWGWCPEAFAEARRRKVPVFVSVGYSSCHWCHVMAQESFSNEQVARLLNEGFVSVKVDREERPDVDSAMMRLTQALTGQGGWPNSVFLTPDGQPFFAGTYFPPVPRGGLPSFTQVLQALSDAWLQRQGEVVASAGEIVARLASINQVLLADVAPEPVALVNAVLSSFDTEHGGFGDAPKFPNAPLLDALLVRSDQAANDAALFTLETMLRGGLHDQVGGGFHRYAVDAGWQVPHFEKMLYDNALLLGTYTRGWRRAVPGDGTEQRELFAGVVEGIVGWLRREMLTDGGAFAASLDADSPDKNGELAEGAYYLWSPARLDEVLSGNSRFAQTVFHVTMGGNMPAGTHSPTDGTGLSTLQFHGLPHPDRTRRVRALLLEARNQRPAPARDDKVVSAWNGWLIDSLVTAAVVFNKPDWLELAKRDAGYLWRVHFHDGVLARSSLDGVVGPDGVCVDYAAVALGFARLAGALGDNTWLARASELLEVALGRFGADDGGFWDAAASDELFARPRQVNDEATPNASAAMVAALRLVSSMTDRPDFASRADQAAATLWQATADAPQFSGAALSDLLEQSEAADGRGPAQIVVVDDDADTFSVLNQAVWRVAPSGSTLVVGKPGTAGFGDLFTGRCVVDEKPTAYICRGSACQAPVTDWAGLREPLWGAPSGEPRGN